MSRLALLALLILVWVLNAVRNCGLGWSLSISSAFFLSTFSFTAYIHVTLSPASATRSHDFDFKRAMSCGVCQPKRMRFSSPIKSPSLCWRKTLSKQITQSTISFHRGCWKQNLVPSNCVMYARVSSSNSKREGFWAGRAVFVQSHPP